LGELWGLGGLVAPPLHVLVQIEITYKLVCS
jgi:hypothetical protein